MALFMPSFVIPDMRSGLGNGVIDAEEDMRVSWRINGSSAMTAFSLTIYQNDSGSTQLYTTGQITDGCPVYGTSSSGEAQIFQYTIDAATLAGNGITNGNEYKLVIRQWWSVNDSVTQSSASVFLTRKTPSLSVEDIGDGGVIDTRFYTFTGVYAQAEGDVLNWFRWKLAYADDTDNPFFDSGNISGTMDISTTYDGFFTGTDYAVRLSCQTENGVEADTGWVPFSAEYQSVSTSENFDASCEIKTDAVSVSWKGIGTVPGVGSGYYDISEPGILTLFNNASISWSQTGQGDMNFPVPWSVLWKGQLQNATGTLFRLDSSTPGSTYYTELRYDHVTNALLYIYVSGGGGGAFIASQSGIPGNATLTVLIGPDKLYIRCDYLTGGLYPSTTLYPGSSVFPRASTVPHTDIYELPISTAQRALTKVMLFGRQVCYYMEVIMGTASQSTIDAAITEGDYVPGSTEADYMMANWQNGIDAGQFFVDDNVIGWALYRRQGTDGAFVKVAETDAETMGVYDYGAVSQGGPYTYYLFPIGEETYIASAIQSNAVSPCWWNWSLLECAATEDPKLFQVLKAYRFRYNVESGAMSNNNNPSLLENFTPYPKIQLAAPNYKSASLVGLLGIVDWSDGQGEYIDTLAWRDALMALSQSENPLFLKSKKGDLLRVQLSGPVTASVMDATPELAQRISLSWAEVGSADGVGLYATEWVAAQEDE